jgi:hypothetical protein
MIDILVLAASVAVACARGLVNLPQLSKLEVVAEVPVEEPACIEGLLFYDVSGSVRGGGFV